MPTKIVAIENIRFMDNLHHLPLATTDGDVDIVVHHNPRVEYNGDRCDTNFLYLITNTRNQMVSDDCQVVLERLDKTKQFIKLLDIMANLDIDSSLKVPKFWKRCNREHKSYAMGLGLPAKAVLKTERGARGISQFLVNTEKLDFSKFMADAASVERSQNGTNGVDEHKMTIDELLRQHPAVLSGDTDRAKDNEKCLFLSQDFFFQEYLDITAEFRINFAVCDNFLEVFTYTRKTDNAKVFKRARMDSTTPEKGKAFLTKHLGAGIANDLFKIIANMSPYIGSMDIAKTKDGVYILEYCNQFGTAVNPGPYAELHTDWLKAYVRSKG